MYEQVVDEQLSESDRNEQVSESDRNEQVSESKLDSESDSDIISASKRDKKVKETQKKVF